MVEVLLRDMVVRCLVLNKFLLCFFIASVFVLNKARQEDFQVTAVQSMQESVAKLFKDSKLTLQGMVLSNLGPISKSCFCLNNFCY